MFWERKKLNNYILCRKNHTVFLSGKYEQIPHNGIIYPDAGFYMNFSKSNKIINGVHPKFWYNYTDQKGLIRTQYVFINSSWDIQNINTGFGNGFIKNHNLYSRIDYAGFMFRAKLCTLANMIDRTTEEKEYLLEIMKNKTNKDLYMYAYTTRDWEIKNIYIECYKEYSNIFIK